MSVQKFTARKVVRAKMIQNRHFTRYLCRKTKSPNALIAQFRSKRRVLIEIPNKNRKIKFSNKSFEEGLVRCESEYRE